MNYAETIGDRIRYFRSSKKMTQDTLAELSEMNTNYLGQVERGEKNVSAVTLNKIIKALDISYSEFYEPIDLGSDSKTIPRFCYDLISEQPQGLQKRILHIIEEIISIATHN